MNLNGAALLDAIVYLPCIRSRQAELRGYSELRTATKEILHPIVALGKLGKVDAAEKVLETIVSKVGPCFLDLNVTPGQACASWGDLCDATDNYANWRALAATAAGVTPIALLRDGTTERPFVRQVLLIEQAFGAVVVRSRKPAHDLASLQAAISVVDDVNNVLIVLDFGYIRGSAEPKLTEARRVITALRTIDPVVRVAVVGSSYPRSISVYGDRNGSLEIMERDFHAQLGGDDVALYGDHASIYPEPFEPSISRWVPRIDFCRDDTWKWERWREDEGGYVRCAQNIVNSADWDPVFAQEAWGAAKILEASRGQVPAGFGSPANWIAARVNMHVERQSARGAAGLPDDDFEDVLG